MVKAGKGLDDIWNKVCETNPKVTTKVGYGRKFTAICAQSQRRKATELFGPHGCGWGVVNPALTYLDLPGGIKQAVYQATMWYMLDKEVYEFPICSTIDIVYLDKTGNLKIDSEWLKKCSTDALTKGLSQLGFNSDIFEGKFDDNRYVQEMNRRFADPSVLGPEPDPPAAPPAAPPAEPDPRVETVKKLAEEAAKVSKEVEAAAKGGKKPPAKLNVFMMLCETAAKEGGRNAFLDVYQKCVSNGITDASRDACKEWIKSTGLYNSWARGTVKKICTDRGMAIEKAAAIANAEDAAADGQDGYSETI
jgi:hypothetical protein